MNNDIDSTLAERGDRYGSFEHHAKIAQDLQLRMQAEAGWLRLADDQRQALTVIMDKIARMLNGDPTYRDNWHDIVGYAKLVDDRMKRDNLAVFRASEAIAAPLPTLSRCASSARCSNPRVAGSDFCVIHQLPFSSPPPRDTVAVPLPKTESVAQATHRDSGGQLYRVSEIDGRWLRWGTSYWYYASAGSDAIPEGLREL